MKSNPLVIRGNVVTPHGIIKNGAVVVEDGRIADVDAATVYGTKSENSTGTTWVLPGIIDTHSDAIETEIQPRPNSHFSFDISFHELERKLAMQGITTIFHSLSMDANDSSGWLRQNESVMQFICDIRKHAQQRPLIRHRIHLRFEITNLRAVPYVEDLLDKRMLDELSFMDHSPGQGQFRNLEIQKKLVMSVHGMSEEEAQSMLEQQRTQPRVKTDKLAEIARLARDCAIPLASHDDDSIEKLAIMEDWDVAISEFPIELSVAIEAKRRGLHVVMGAPNVLLGRSHSDNLSALTAIEHGVVDILCSDYYPPSLLQSVFTLHGRGMPMHQAVNMVSLNPAKALGLADQTGSIEVGKIADLLVVSDGQSIPSIHEVYVGGSRVCKMHYADLTTRL